MLSVGVKKNTNFRLSECGQDSAQLSFGGKLTKRTFKRKYLNKLRCSIEPVGEKREEAVARRRHQTCETITAVWGEEPSALPLGRLRRTARRDWESRAARRREGEDASGGLTTLDERRAPGGKAERAEGVSPTHPHDRNKEGRGGRGERARIAVVCGGKSLWLFRSAACGGLRDATGKVALRAAARGKTRAGGRRLWTRGEPPEGRQSVPKARRQLIHPRAKLTSWRRAKGACRLPHTRAKRRGQA
ncbi:hypothetical protein C8J57DRAFT_1264947 [Mycena rebaudengoi]|nr:hypothetical protein C8J57DRAFT_1264947 [Mycena rebaudengoi]